MSGDKSKPMIGLLIGSLVSGSKSGGLVEFATSPRSHKETTINTQSPKGMKSFDFGGVGLGIVAALEKSGDDGSKNHVNKSLISRKLSRSNPIPVNSPKINSSRNRGELEDVETESLEDYTTVTCHVPNKSYTNVYRNGIEGGRKGDSGTPFRIQNSTKSSVFHISPPRFGEVIGIPATDFLNSCNLCQKKLHGKDIYMYRGEKAFCSSECRYRQMVKDERKEKCRSEASRPAVDNISSSPYTNGGICTAGILAI